MPLVNKLSMAFIFILLIGCTAQKPINRPVKIKAEVCEHYNGANATILIVTDKYIPFDQKQYQHDNRRFGTAWAEFLAFKYNIPIHVFEEDMKIVAFKEFLTTGRGGASVYYPSCKTIYSKLILERKIKDIESLSGKKPTTLSYGCGKTSYADSLPEYILGGRNSDYTACNSGDSCITWYGKNAGYSGRLDFSDSKNIISRPSSGRFFSDITNKADITAAEDFVKKQVQITSSNAGFYVNFLHWHEYYWEKKQKVEAVRVMENLYQAVSEGIGNSKISKIDYNQAVEYLYAKEAVDTVYFSKNKKMINLEFRYSKKRKIDYSVIQIPLTIKFEKKKNSPLNYHKILTSDKVVNAYQDDKFIYLNIKPDYTLEKEVIPLLLGNRLILPELWHVPKLTYSLTEQTLSVTKPSKFVLFMKKQGEDAFKVEVIDRTFDFMNQYNLVTRMEGYDYYLGAITEEGESSLLEIN